jgi:hypothetical protein
MTTTSCPFRSSPNAVKNRGWRLMSVFGRMKPGVDIDRCRSDLSLAAASMERDHPEKYKPAYGYSIAPAMLREELTREARPVLLLLLATAAFILLIACANVANLTLARMARRERELTIRFALGAESGRLMRQLLTESFPDGHACGSVGTRQQVFAAGIDLNWSKYTTQTRIRSVSDRLLAKVQSLPGVLSAVNRPGNPREG